MSSRGKANESADQTAGGGAAGAGGRRRAAVGRAPGAGPETVPTPPGDARITWHPAVPAVPARCVLALGHGAGGGIEARDLAALAAELPGRGVHVALVEQPWRVAGKKLAPAPRTLDAGWSALWPRLAAPGLPVVAGGRSAGARVACRTAAELGAAAVLALAFPLHPPGRPERSRAGELLDAAAAAPLLVVQGGADPFGRPSEFPAGRRPVEVPHADHGFAVPKRAATTQEEALAVLVDAVTGWLAGLGRAED
ncbi:alpha/beta hydrolase family protein [Actinacidiphila yeochonensis]|uniref:alpha/beta hydrolase family protein n=1 Tax=Actinacidiphila yeochonensis TaxID=89050 RepID=UPI000A82128D|nr:alpha/beta family hydrolase [Actinacidiphila yeochonensis]